jgi:hypothetical protein
MVQKIKSFMTKEIPSKWVFVFIAILLILSVLVNFSKYLTVPEWMLPYTFYALMTAIFGFVFWVAKEYMRDNLDIRKKKELKRIQVLKELKKEYERCNFSVQSNLGQYIDKNKTTDFAARLYESSDVGDLKFPEALKKEIEKYNDEIRDYNIFLKASDSFIRDNIEKNVRRMFRKTLEKNNELHVVLCNPFLLERFLDGEPVTRNWLNETNPIMLKNIIKDIDESERIELDVLFNEINNSFRTEEILNRFRQQKHTIRELANKIAEQIQKEISSLDVRLQKYDYL